MSYHVITAVCQHKKNRKTETNKESDTESLSHQPGLRPVLHLRTHRLHPLQFLSSNPPH